MRPRFESLNNKTGIWVQWTHGCRSVLMKKDTGFYKGKIKIWCKGERDTWKVKAEGSYLASWKFNRWRASTVKCATSRGSRNVEWAKVEAVLLATLQCLFGKVQARPMFIKLDHQDTLAVLRQWEHCSLKLVESWRCRKRCWRLEDPNLRIHAWQIAVHGVWFFYGRMVFWYRSEDCPAR